MSQELSSSKLIIAGGGTGGHVLAGLAVAENWPSREVIFIGSSLGLENKIIPPAGYSLRIIPVGPLNQVALSKKLKTLLQLPFAFLKCLWILLAERPTYILGVGGYSSGPVLFSAAVLKKCHLLKTTLAILEQNSIPGLTNRLLSHYVDLIFSAFPTLSKYIPHCPIVVTGNPIRSTMKLMSPPPTQPFTLFIFGGSQGAIGMNSLILEALPYLAQDPVLVKNLSIVHQTGPRDYERVRLAYRSFALQVRVEAFIEDMASVYEASSLLICRAGSSTLAEIAMVGRAAILIPLPTSTDHHQEQNAEALVQAGAALLFHQKPKQGQALAEQIRTLFYHPERLVELTEKIRSFSRPDAAKNLVQAFLKP